MQTWLCHSLGKRPSLPSHHLLDNIPTPQKDIKGSLWSVPWIAVWSSLPAHLYSSCPWIPHSARTFHSMPLMPLRETLPPGMISFDSLPGKKLLILLIPTQHYPLSEVFPDFSSGNKTLWTLYLPLCSYLYWNCFMSAFTELKVPQWQECLSMFVC